MKSYKICVFFRPLEIAVFKWIQEIFQSTDHEVSSKQGLDYNKSFSQLGGDSLSATHLSSLLREHLSLELPVDVILKTPLAELVTSIPSAKGPSTASIDWVKEASIDSLGLDDHPQRPLSDVPEVSSSVLLTGCTGFLGRFILWELLLDSRITQVFCLTKEKNGSSTGDSICPHYYRFSFRNECKRKGNEHPGSATTGISM